MRGCDLQQDCDIGVVAPVVRELLVAYFYFLVNLTSSL
jgi:hypothetical protein